MVLLEGSSDRDSLELLDAGANDCVVKPVSAADLSARIRVWLRHAARSTVPPTPSRPPAARLRIDRERQLVFVQGRAVHLTRTECLLLGALSRSRIGLSEEQMIAEVWGPSPTPQARRHLRAHLRQLRHKIEKDPLRPRHLVKDAAGGYRLAFG